MCLSSGELIAAMIDSKVLAIADINKAIVATPAVRINDAIGFYFAPDNGLQCSFRAIRNDLRVDFAVTFEDAEDDCFTICTTSSFPFNTASTQKRFVYFNLSRKRRFESPPVI